MTHIASVGTYLPPWGTDLRRVAGSDEDAVTMAISAGRAALSGLSQPPSITQVVFVTRDFPLLEGGNGAVLLAGLGLDPGLEVVERSGAAAAALDAVLSAGPGTLIVTADLEPAGGAAAVVSDTDAGTTRVIAGERTNASLPVRARGTDGVLHDYGDPRLLRDRGLRVALARLSDDKLTALAGTAHGDAAAACKGDPPVLPTTGASSALFALAALTESRTEGALAAVDQATLASARVLTTGATVVRDQRAARKVPKSTYTPGPEIPISLASYDRAFQSKITFSAAKCDVCGTLSSPPRRRCLECQAETPTTLTPLPRRGVVYTTTTINVPIPSLTSPYSLAIVELDGADVRMLAKVTAAEPGSMRIGDAGSMVLRKVADRSGVPEYGYAFLPDDEEMPR